MQNEFRNKGMTLFKSNQQRIESVSLEFMIIHAYNIATYAISGGICSLGRFALHYKGQEPEHMATI